MINIEGDGIKGVVREQKNGVQIHDHECGKPTQFEQKAPVKAFLCQNIVSLEKKKKKSQ